MDPGQILWQATYQATKQPTHHIFGPFLFFSRLAVIATRIFSQLLSLGQKFCPPPPPITLALAPVIFFFSKSNYFITGSREDSNQESVDCKYFLRYFVNTDTDTKENCNKPLTAFMSVLVSVIYFLFRLHIVDAEHMLQPGILSNDTLLDQRGYILFRWLFLALFNSWSCLFQARPCYTLCGRNIAITDFMSSSHLTSIHT